MPEYRICVRQMGWPRQTQAARDRNACRVERLERDGSECLVLRGGMGKRARASVLSRLEEVRPGSGLVLVATGSYLGEGFDCPSLDALFLAFPLAFKGRLVQYVGRVMRPVEGKTSVEVHDYVDMALPVLARMHAKRLPVFSNLGFRELTRERRSN